ncbi:MAG: DNA-binding protein [Elusimicrobia bacterium RIFOXYA2_FULL_39_19]|nr:MAG: DNA-binding protein [Elusimicrobia bacterium RIFOXYA2_FULL_39_19]
MKFTEASIKRVFILRLEHKDRVPDAIEKFAQMKEIRNGMCIMVGGVDKKSKIVVGPKNGDKMPPFPMEYMLNGVHEVAAVGTIFCNETGQPKLHMHAALGRKGKTRTGCVRLGINIWKTCEVVIFELINSSARRVKDKETGFELLEV